MCPIDVSSAKSLLSPSMSSAMSFTNTKNNRGPRTDPWGTPAFKSSNSDNDIMICNISNQQDELSFDFDGIVLNSVNKHKHLGIIFSSDCK
jgi:hypothetical protein